MANHIQIESNDKSTQVNIKVNNYLKIRPGFKTYGLKRYVLEAMSNCRKVRRSLKQSKFLAMKKFEIEKKSHREICNPLNNGEEDSFHRAIWPVLVLAQGFALLPVIGVKSPNSNHLRFQWKSFRAALSILFLIISILIVLAYLKHISFQGINAKNIVGVIFYSVGVVICLMFLQLAQKWPLLMKTWRQAEKIFLVAPYQTPKWRLATRIRVVAGVMLSLAFLEHLLYLASTVYNYRMAVYHCNVTEGYQWKDFFITSFPHIFSETKYHFILTLFYLVINSTFTFIWNYIDLFIIMISLGISIRFEQLNLRISPLKGKDIPEFIWTDVRIHFIQLCELLAIVDTELSAIILISCTNSLYFICTQLLNIFNKLRFAINYIYFWYSLLYLIGRTACVFLCAARINDESKKPLVILRSVPSSSWCGEIERFIDQITTQCVALSGMKFFYLTRKLLFGMAGTIVTYELVLLQFDEPNRLKGLPPLC